MSANPTPARAVPAARAAGLFGLGVVLRTRPSDRANAPMAANASPFRVAGGQSTRPANISQYRKSSEPNISPTASSIAASRFAAEPSPTSDLRKAMFSLGPSISSFMGLNALLGAGSAQSP